MMRTVPAGKSPLLMTTSPSLKINSTLFPKATNSKPSSARSSAELVRISSSEFL